MPPPLPIGPSTAAKISQLIVINLIYTVIIAVLALYGFFKTKLAYTLTKHKGILYFRLSFLFLAIMFIIRLATRLLFEINRTTSLHIPLHKWTFLGLALSGILSLICLLYSLLWHIFEPTEDKDHAPLVLIGIALILSFLAIQGRAFNTLVGIIIVSFIACFIIKWVSTTKKKWFWKTGTIYLSFFVFWMLNLYTVMLANQRVLLRAPIFIGSTLLFLFIAYKVHCHFPNLSKKNSKKSKK